MSIILVILVHSVLCFTTNPVSVEYRVSQKNLNNFIGFLTAAEMLILSAVLVGWISCVSAAYMDLTHTINTNSVSWYKEHKFVLTPILRNTDPFWVAINQFSTTEHGGTHIDAPYHFKEDGWKLGEIPLDRLFMVEGILINKTEEALRDRDYQLTVKDIENWEEINGPIPEKSVVLVTFGWAVRYPDRKTYLGLGDSEDNADTERHFPSITAEAAQWFVDSGKVYGVGTDTASPDRTLDLVCHKILNKQNLFILENLNLSNLEGVPAKGFKLAILPMKIEEGTGGPTRVVLQIDNSNITPHTEGEL